MQKIKTQKGRYSDVKLSHLDRDQSESYFRISGRCLYNISFFPRTANGAELLFQAKDDDEMNQWVQAIGAQCEGGASGPAKSQTLPAGPAPGEQKKRSFFTLKKT